MANRTAVDVVQKLLGRSLAPFVRANDVDPRVGVVNDWYTAYTSVIGSVDHYHKIGFQFVTPDHPLYLTDLSDPIQVGYINADLSSVGKDSHLWPSGAFDAEWCPCPNGEDEYPAWDGWPVLDSLLPDYPEYLSAQIPVFTRGLLLSVVSLSSAITYDKWFRVTLPRPFAESLWAADSYEDIWVFRFASSDSTGGWHPTGDVFRVQAELHESTDEIYIRVGRSTGSQEGIDTPPAPTFYMIYWASPDDYASTLFPGPSFAGGDEQTAFVTITDHTQRDLFDRDRYDLVSYATGGLHYIRHTRSTRYALVDGNPEHYDDPNPMIYDLPGLIGSLDPAFDPTAETPGGGYASISSIWGYGYSIDMGTNDPADRECVVAVIVCYQPSAGQGTDLLVVQGPVVPPEFQPGRWEDFTYYPPTPTGYQLFAKLVVAQLGTGRDAAYRPTSYIAHIDYVPSYGRVAIPNADFRIAMSPTMTGRGSFSLNISSATDQGLKAILLVTPYTSNRLTGLLDGVGSHMNDREVSIIGSYWRMPFEHPETVTVGPAVTNVTDYILNAPYGIADMLEFERYMRDAVAQVYGFQLSVRLASFNGDITADDGGLTIHDDKRMLLPRPIEIFFPADATCLHDGVPGKLNRDYSLRMMFVNDTADTIQKDLFMSASRYWITDNEAAERLAAAEPRDSYLWPTKIDAIYQWQVYGRTLYLPDTRGGEVHKLLMRQFQPGDPNLPTYDAFVADLEAQYADELASTDAIVRANAQQDIDDAIAAQEYQYGGFSVVDSRTISGSFVGLDSLTIGVTLFTTTGVATWKAASRMWAGDHPDMYLFLTDGNPKVRYGFTVAGQWYYQEFDSALVEAARREYIAEHPQDDPVLKEQTNADGADNALFALDGDTVLLSATFTADFVPVCAEVASVTLQLRRVGVPKARFVVTLNTTDGTTKAPTVVQQQSEEFDSDLLTEDFTSITFTFTRPATLSDSVRYAISLVTTDPTGEDTFLDADNRIEWAYADRDIHSYGVTTTSSQLVTLTGVVDGVTTIIPPYPGMTSLTVIDGSVFPVIGFYIRIEDEVLQVSSRSGNILYLVSPTTDYHTTNAWVYEVVYVPSDSEVRWTMAVTTQGTYSWVAPTDPTFDATYVLTRPTIEVGLVQEVLPAEWAGVDIRVTEAQNDAFYIAPTGESYDTDFEDSNMFLYGYASGLTPMGGFNVADTYGFPPMNTLRVHSTNMTDGYICWNSTRLDSPQTLTIYPLCRVTSHVISYMPTATAMYITAICRRWDGTTETVELLLPAGTVAPVLLSSEEFVSIDMLWVNAGSFAETPYGASEHFEIRAR